MEMCPETIFTRKGGRKASWKKRKRSERLKRATP